jgi:ribosome modulation factor
MSLAMRNRYVEALERAWQRGENARRCGIVDAKNPYKMYEYRYAWADGYAGRPFKK